ncbi:MAG: hypothetical protein K9G64_06365 [Bacteroidia bacterium]|jgi:hypothetical protein|nr:hypothetical protein [Bacteroidia bacterium]
MKTKFTVIFILLMGFFYSAKSQDLIYKKNKEVITAKVIELGIDEIKYKDYNDQNGPTLVIDKNEIDRIRFESGKIQYFGGDNLSNYANNKKNAIKIDFLSPMFGQTTFGYEHSLKPGASVEFQLGIIGWGVNNYSDYGGRASGAFFRAGYKFITSPDFYLRGMRYTHILKGSYFRPEITYGLCTESNNTINYSSSFKSQDVNFGAVMLNFGKQWVMDDIFIVDYFFGIGYGYKSNNSSLMSTNPDKNIYWGNSHAFLGPYGDFPFAWTTGLKVGFLIK